MKKSEFKKLTLDKAKKDLEKNKKDLFTLRFQQVNGQLTNTSKFNSTIARKDCLSSLFDDTSPTFIPAITTSSPTFNPPICPNSAFMYLPFF